MIAAATNSLHSTGTSRFNYDGQANILETDSTDATTVVYTNRPAPYGDIISVRRNYEPPE